MLKVDPRTLEASEPVQLPDITISQVLSFIDRSRRAIAVFFAISLACGLLYLMFATPVFIAKAALAIDPRRSQMLPMAESAESVMADSFHIQTQVGLLKSESVLIATIRAEKLLDDPAFSKQSSRSVISRILGAAWPGAEDAPTEQVKLRLAIQKLEDGIDVQQAGLTNLIEISYRSDDPALPPRIANAVARAYINEQLEDRSEATRRAGEWLQNRIAELRAQSQKAARAVADFKTANKIVDTPRGRMNEQQLGELNSQLVLARAQTAEAQAKLARIEEMLNQGKPDAVASEALRNDVITRLRNQYIDLSQRESEIAGRFGRDHSAAVAARAQMEELGRIILSELRRVAEGLRSDYEIARSRQESLEAGVASAVQETATANQAEVTMRELESGALAIKTIYEAFLQRYTKIVQVQSFPIPEARLVTEASRPLKRSWPHGKIIMPIAAVAGLLLGLGFALLREQLRNGMMQEEDLQRLARADVLGVAARASVFDPDRNSLFYAADHPHSPLAENMRVIETSLRQKIANTGTSVLGVASANAGEGASKLAASLASMSASSGARVLLVDGHLRRPVLTPALDLASAGGLADLANAAPGGGGKEFIARVRNFDFLPAGRAAGVYLSEILKSPGATAFLANAREDYELIIVDLPPVLPTVDARASVGAVDSFVFAVRWARSNRNAVRKAISILRGAGGSIAGCVFMDAEVALIDRFKSFYVSRPGRLARGAGKRARQWKTNLSKSRT